MIKPMYRLNPELGRYEKLYLYGDHQAEENMKKILQRQGIQTLGSFKEGSPQSLKDAAVILCGIDSEMADLLRKAHVVFIPPPLDVSGGNTLSGTADGRRSKKPGCGRPRIRYV